MFKKSTARVVALGAVIGSLAAFGAAAPAGAAPVRFPVDVVVHTVFGVEPSAFEGNIPGCPTGTVEEGGGGPHYTPWGGSFNGVKEFTCDGGEAGFDVRLHARFGELGSTGSWTLIDAWGFLEGVKASGSLVGVPTEGGIDDRYIGSAR